MVMEWMELALSQRNPFALDYINGKQQTLSFFDYFYIDQQNVKQRLADLKERTFPREVLVDYLLANHEALESDKIVFTQIEKLRDPKSVAVIGGQQAGVLTGPLYTIHKCISIIRMAREQEQRLDVPVVPLFWIAGEDHDFEEINHTTILKNGQATKLTVPTKIPMKIPTSQISLDQVPLKKWVAEVVRSLGEAEYTQEVYDFLLASLEKSKTYVDWFARLLTGLFGSYGLVLLDSNDPRLRKIEAPFFAKMIENNRRLGDAVLVQLKQVENAGYPAPVDIGIHSANLFYHVNGERILLERDEVGHFHGKNNECFLSEKELYRVAMDEPEKLSNNVLTRPLMQELLLPTLAFIAGPGEIAYWGTLKKAFHLMGCTLPPLVPRLNITLVDLASQKWLKAHHIEVQDVFSRGLQTQKEQWLSVQKTMDIQKEAEETKRQIASAHSRLQEVALQIDAHELGPLGEKNKGHLFKQVDYYVKQIERVYNGKFERELARFNLIETYLLPRGKPQERIWGVLPFLNHHGFALIASLMDMSLSFNGEHKVVFLP